jgi:hypothetical protein
MAVMPKNEEPQQEVRPPVRLFRLLIDQYNSALDAGMPDTAHTFLRTLGLAIKHELGEEQKQPLDASFTISGEDVLIAYKRGMETDRRFRSVTSIVRNGDTIGELSEGRFESGPKAPVLSKVNSADLFDRIKQLLPGIKPAKAPKPTIPASALRQFDEVVAGLRQAAEVLSTRSRTVSVTPTGGLLFSPALSLAERMGLDLGTTTKSQWDLLQEFAKGNAVECSNAEAGGQSIDKKTLESLADRVYFGTGDLVFEFDGFDGNTYIIQDIDGDNIGIQSCRDIALGKGKQNQKVVKSSALGFLRRAGDFPPIQIAERPKRERTNTNRAEPG